MTAMTPAEHYEAAEKLCVQAERFTGHPAPQHVQWAALSQAHALLALYQPPPEPSVMVQQPPPEKAKASTERKLIGPSWVAYDGGGFVGECVGCDWKVPPLDSTANVIKLFDLHMHEPADG